MQNRVVSKSLNKNHPNDEKSNKSAITKTHISAMHLYYASFSAMKNHRSAHSSALVREAHPCREGLSYHRLPPRSAPGATPVTIVHNIVKTLPKAQRTKD